MDKTRAKSVDDVFVNLTGLQRYPRHAKGAGYFLSRSLAEFLAASAGTLEQLPCEDTAIGAYLA
eukprot:5307323-Amphidinium_carterae.1